MATRCIAAVFLALFCGTIAGSAADPSELTPTARQIDAWIEQLDHDDFQQREEASRKLIDAGTQAISAVAVAAASDSQEVAWRAGVVLQQIGISGDEQAMSEVMRAMAKLEQAGKRSFKDSGAEIIRRWQQYRHEQAVASVRDLGGEVIEASPDEVFAAGFGGGFGGGFIPAIPLEGPVIVDFDFEAVRAIPVPRVEGLRLEAVEEAKAKVARPADKLIEAIEPLELPKLPAGDVRLGSVKEPDDAETAIDPVKPQAGRKTEVIKADAVDRFAEELKKEGIDLRPLTLRIAKQAADRVKGEEGDDAEVEIDEPIEFLDLDDLVAPEPAPVAPVFDGGLAGGVALWSPAGTSSRQVRLSKEWKGGSQDLKLLREVAGLATLQLDDFNLDATAIKQIAKLKKLSRLQVKHSKFDREELLALKRARPNLSIYATGKTLLGVSGQPHPEGFQITSVVEGSAAHQAGVHVGDILTQTEGIKLSSVDELTIAIAHKNVGDPLAITFQRDGKTYRVEAKLGPR